MPTFNTAGLALLARLIAGEQIATPVLIFLDLEVPQYFVAGSSVPLAWGGHTWEPLDIGIKAIDDDASELNGLVFALPGVDAGQIALAFADVDGSTVRVYQALVDPDTAEAADAALIWSGMLDIPGFEEGARATVLLTAEHRGAAALRPKPSRYTNDEQQRLYPGDTSLDFDPATDAGQLVWPGASWARQEGG